MIVRGVVVLAILGGAGVDDALATQPAHCTHLEAEIRDEGSGDGISAGIVTAMVGVLGVFGTLLGVWLTDWLGQGRERRAQQLAWNKQLFEKYEPAYRKFLASWGGSEDPRLLKQAFDRLLSEAIVPGHLIDDVDATLRSIAPGGDPGVRSRAAHDLYVSFRALIVDPLGFVAQDSS